RTEIERLWGGGDSTDWTATYLVSQAMRYRITGEAQARSEVIRIADYLHVVHDITDDPGYIARIAAFDAPPWNRGEYENCEHCYAGTGEYEGYFWQGAQSRDKYMHWFWALTWAHTTVDDAEMRATIEEDMVSVLQTLIDNDWTIIDPFGDTYSASSVGPDLQLTFILQTAVVTGDPYWWNLLDTHYEMVKGQLYISAFAFFNKYFDYYAFINNQAIMQPIFSLWPDRERLQEIYDIWYKASRRWTVHTHQAFFDAVEYGVCRRLGNCDPGEMTYMENDIAKGLAAMNEAPNYQRATTCPDLPLDPFSVWADNLISKLPFLENLININPQTAEPHEIADRCWVSVLWERSPYHIECTQADLPEHVTHGADYLIAYWMGVYWGALPGDGPYGDDDFVDDPVTGDDDDGDDDSESLNDDVTDDPVTDDDDDDDDSSDDDDVSDDDDDDDDSGCGC
ncbi:hypothetical protein KDL45_17125, partial [bacterium]|nr:hypothetical protein [bacterium]